MTALKNVTIRNAASGFFLNGSFNGLKYNVGPSSAGIVRLYPVDIEQRAMEVDLETLILLDSIGVDVTPVDLQERSAVLSVFISTSSPASEAIGSVPKDHKLEVAAGRIPGTSGVNKFGANDGIPAETRGDVNDMGGVYPYPTTADMTHMSQDIDQVALRGAIVEIDGLDSASLPIIQLLTLDASDTSIPVALITPLLRVNTMQIQYPVKADSDIKLHNLAKTAIYSQITSDNQQTLQTNYSVAKGYTAFMTNVYGDVIEGVGKEPKAVEFKLWVSNRKDDWEFQLKSARGVAKAGAPVTHKFDPYYPIPEMHDIKITAQPKEQPAHVHAGFDLYLEKNK